MESDVQFHVLLKGVPQLVKPLLGIDSDLPYVMRSESFKDLKFSADGVLDCEQAKVAYIVEFQAHRETDGRTVYHRAVIEHAMYHVDHPGKEVRVIVLYLTKALDARVAPWVRFADQIDERYIEVLYLDEIIASLKAEDPDHPAVLVFAPLLETDDAVLQQSGASYVHKIIHNTPNPNQRETLLKVFLNWFTIRFEHLNEEEVAAMLELGRFEDTAFYKSVAAKEHKKSQIRYVKEKMALMDQLRQEGDLTEAGYRRQMAALKSELAELEGRDLLSA